MSCNIFNPLGYQIPGQGSRPRPSCCLGSVAACKERRATCQVRGTKTERGWCLLSPPVAPGELSARPDQTSPPCQPASQPEPRHPHVTNPTDAAATPASPTMTTSLPPYPPNSPLPPTIHDTPSPSQPMPPGPNAPFPYCHFYRCPSTTTTTPLPPR